MYSPPLGEIGQLRAARVAVSKDYSAWRRRRDGRKELVFGHGYGHLVMSAFHAEVSCQSAASTELLYVGTCLLKQLRVWAPPHDGMVMAMWLGYDRCSIKVWWCPPRHGCEELGEGVCRCRDRLCCLCPQQF
ncbi:hypothetical protein StoSoilB22_18530 [Arthrobacter sp. StoSoilB22]|nr:hypothetical protein StoSoilB22_18530 [Arthrobacter sp. StoSoilB22]